MKLVWMPNGLGCVTDREEPTQARAMAPTSGLCEMKMGVKMPGASWRMRASTQGIFVSELFSWQLPTPTLMQLFPAEQLAVAVPSILAAGTPFFSAQATAAAKAPAVLLLLLR